MIMKKSVTDLAFLGGSPLFGEKLYVGRPNLCAREKIHAALDEIFDRRWLTNDGPFVRRFEERLQEYLGVKHCITVCNATIGLQMVYRALGIPRHSGNAVMPSFTFVATAHALAWEGGTPVFCDVDRATHLVSPADMESKINADTTLLVGVHTWGQPCNVEQLESLSKSRRIPLVFDAAHAFANRAGSRSIGGFGDAEVFSFHATKFLNSFEGGMISTNHDGLAQELKYMRNFGFAGFDKVCALGTNGKMSEISAAMGLCMLDEVDQLLEINRRNYRLYQQAFDGWDEFSLLKLEQPDSLNCQYIVGAVAEDAPEHLRDLLVDVLWKENVLARRYFYPGVHRAAPYSEQDPVCSLPVTDDLCRRVVVFPTGSAILPEDIEKLSDLVRFILKNADEIRRLRGSRE
jgi:dTDP-4-amino-4,6-dideoxygalactose transaminase